MKGNVEDSGFNDSEQAVVTSWQSVCPHGPCHLPCDIMVAYPSTQCSCHVPGMLTLLLLCWLSLISLFYQVSFTILTCADSVRALTTSLALSRSREGSWQSPAPVLLVPPHHSQPLLAPMSGASFLTVGTRRTGTAADRESSRVPHWMLYSCYLTQRMSWEKKKFKRKSTCIHLIYCFWYFEETRSLYSPHTAL